MLRSQIAGLELEKTKSREILTEMEEQLDSLKKMEREVGSTFRNSKIPEE